MKLKQELSELRQIVQQLAINVQQLAKNGNTTAKKSNSGKNSGKQKDKQKASFDGVILKINDNSKFQNFLNRLAVDITKHNGKQVIRIRGAVRSDKSGHIKHGKEKIAFLPSVPFKSSNYFRTIVMDYSEFLKMVAYVLDAYGKTIEQFNSDLIEIMQ